MIYQDFKNIKVSWLGMGNMRLPVKDDAIDREKAQEIIDYAMTNGINYFDTSYVYHNSESEKFLGDALEKYPRDSYYLATKFFINANPDYKAVFEEQCERLKTDYIDFYLIHGIFDTTYQGYIDSGCIAYFEELKAQGRIKYLGFSAHASIENFTTFVNHHQWDFTMIMINPYDWLFGRAKEEYEILRELNIPIISMEPIRGGRLASLSPEAEKMLKEVNPDWSIVEWMIRWAKNRTGNIVVLSGMTTLDQIKENVRLLSDDKALSDDEEVLLHQAMEVFRKELQVPCTDCRYCIEDGLCHANIDIPEYLRVFNAYKVDGFFALSGLDNIESDGKPTDCTTCGKCAARCPQTIDIQGIMSELSEIIKQREARQNI